jgi:glycosyltransferase involved in cell wall biosynthesis
MKNIIFFSEQPLYFGNTAGVIRLNHYAKALLLNDGVRVYQVPFSSNCKIDNIECVDTRHFVFTNDFRYVRKSGFRLFKQVKNFLKNLYIFSNSLNGSTVLLYYPANGSILDIISVFILKYVYKLRIYVEVNEIPIFYSVHEFRTSKVLIKKILLYFLDFTFRFYDGMICISESIQLYYRKRHSRIIVIPILCNCDLFRFSHHGALNPKENTSEVLVFAGTISYEKENLEQLIKGIRLCLDQNLRVKLLLYGTITKDSYHKISNLIFRLSLNTSVELCGSYENSRITEILSRGDALILPRNNTLQNTYGFSTKLSEYVLSGIPIIMTNTGPIKKYFTDNFNCLLVDGYDANSFYLKIKEFILMKYEDRLIISRNAYQTAKFSFNYELFSHKLNNFLNF